MKMIGKVYPIQLSSIIHVRYIYQHIPLKNYPNLAKFYHTWIVWVQYVISVSLNGSISRPIYVIESQWSNGGLDILCWVVYDDGFTPIPHNQQKRSN